MSTSRKTGSVFSRAAAWLQPLAANRRVRALIQIAAVSVLVVAANYLGAKHYVQWDATEGGLYTLSARTTNILGQLDEDIRIVSFLGLGASPLGPDALEQIEDVLETYRSENPARIRLESIDVVRDSLRAEALLRELDIDPFRDGTDVVVVEAGERRRQVRLEELVEFDMSAGMGGPPPVRAITAESALTSAILSVTRERKPVIAFATGHGERAMRGRDPFDLGRFADALEREDAELVTWDARSGTPVPARADVVIVASPTEPWQERERDALSAYLDAGGRALLFLDPVPQRAGAGELVPSGLEPVLEARGLVARGDIVLDPAATYRGNMAEFVAEIAGGHAATGGLQGLGILVTVSRSIDAAESAGGHVVETILESSGDSWGETDLEALFRGDARQDEADRAGPRPLVVMSRRAGEKGGTADETGLVEPADASGDPANDASDTAAPGDRPPRESRLIVAGDVDLAANDALGNPGNRGLALNLVSYLLEEERSLGIPPKDRALSRLFLTRDQLVLLFPVVVLVLPAAAVIAAVLLWLRRRRD